MTAAILEIKDGMATGPLHVPVKKRLIDKNLYLHFKDVEPLSWPTVCGVTGYVYQRDGLLAMGATVDCPDCLALRVPRPRDMRGLPCTECGAIRHRDARGFRCQDCYRAAIIRAQHGTRSRYVAGCRCDECRKAERDYQRQYKRDVRAGVRIQDPWRRSA